VPPLAGIPNGYYAERGSAEHLELVTRVETGELSQAVIIDDELANRKPIRDLFCPRDFDTTYVSGAVYTQLGCLGVKWLTESFSPIACHTASLEEYVKAYQSTHDK